MKFVREISFPAPTMSGSATAASRPDKCFLSRLPRAKEAIGEANRNYQSSRDLLVTGEFFPVQLEWCLKSRWKKCASGGQLLISADAHLGNDF